MQIIPRKLAKSLGLNKYFTGKPCTNGHFSERYVGSGGCQECINGKDRTAMPKPSNATPDVAAQRATITRVKDETVSGRFRVWDVDVRAFERIAIQLGQMRYPGAPAEMFRAKKGPTKVDTDNAMHEVWFHPDDKVMVFEAAQAMRRKHCISPAQLAQDIARIHRTVESFVNTTVENEINAGYNYDKLSIK